MVTRIRPPRSDQMGGPNRRGQAGPKPNGTPGDVGRIWRSLVRHIPRLREDLAWYATAQGDRARLIVTRFVTRAAFGILLLITASALLAVAGAFVIAGAAGGVAAALDGKTWLANLITGIATLALLFAAIAIAIKSNRRQRLARLRRRYERHAHQPSPAAPGGDPTGASHAE